MSRGLLVLNSGSSTLKFSLFEAGTDAWPPLLAHGEVTGIGSAPALRLTTSDQQSLPASGAIDFVGSGHEDVLAALTGLFARLFESHPLSAVGHRVVHGGARDMPACRVDATVLAELTALVPLAPLHQAHNLAPIGRWLIQDPHLPQFAAFDTAFHRSITAAHRRYPLPADLAAHGVERYGFHGLSYEYVAHRLRALEPTRAGGRCVVLHLGAGASACALDHGRSVSTSMGFTALDGLAMATRCGSLDPGVVLHLIEHQGLQAAELRERLYHDSGLLALSGGLSGDMRVLLASHDPAAADAIEHFCWRARREVGALTAELGGLDTLVFTAGIGAHAAPVRSGILAGLEFLGVAIDPAANAANAECISSPASAVRVLVLETDEEAMVAHHVRSLLQSALKFPQLPT